MNRFSKFYAMCIALVMSFAFSPQSQAALIDEVSEHGRQLTEEFVFPDWNEVGFVFEDENNKWYSNYYYKRNLRSNGGTDAPLNAIVDITENSVFTFRLINHAQCSLDIRIDDVLYESYNTKEIIPKGRSSKPFFIDLTPGKHNISLEFSGEVEISDIGIIKTPSIEVNLAQPGSLATEILYNVNYLTDVRILKVKGEMNNEDMAKLSMTKDKIYMIDLSEAQLPNGEIPAEAFSGAYFLRKMVLPEGIKRINNGAFGSSSIEEINFPSTIDYLGVSCFSNTCIKEAIFTSDDITFDVASYSKSSGLFSDCVFLRKVVLPRNMRTIKADAFSNCYNLYDITLPEELETIEKNAFNGCNGLGNDNNGLIIPGKCTSIGSQAFAEVKFTSVTLPACFFQHIDNSEYALFGNAEIGTMRLQSPSVVYVPNNNFINEACQNTILEVPDFLVVYYKQDPSWYKFKEIRGYSTEGTREWIIRGDLTLDSHNRWTDEPNTTLKETASMKVYGTDPLVIGDLTVENNLATEKYSRLISSIDNFTVNGALSANEYMQEGKWYYIALPFNVKVGDITFVNGTAQKAIRYYDGANRAANGTGNNWVNCTAETIIPAGTGFIFQTSAAGYWNFPARADESKSYITDFKMFAKELAANPSSEASNRGWNLVGNPYQAWYNIHKLNFTAPITVRNVNSDTYEAYSIIDDDYALAPNQAFFVQCTDETTEISFPLNGRQMTSEITDQNGAPAKNPQVSRVLVDLALNNSDNFDRTRIVLNNKASMSYETTCDASKFLSESNVAQVYTLDNEGTIYAINERPVQNGEVKLGVIIPENGNYSFSLLRNMADNVYVRDNETGKTVDITNGVYDFYAKVGTTDNRFTVIIKSDVATGIKDAVQESSLDTQSCYSLSGQKVGASYKGIVIKNGKKVVLK